eukprot:TRINITY_DN11591_c0_g1_i1.p1 TRINITY_DN11591_c0_g1~~TRINITY_DN11591_c0_g1_i1.p1  ORF type:complete len:179 (+),score=1.70 TRINITY_DN11591_c0_g1_i1:18-554(+)
MAAITKYGSRWLRSYRRFYAVIPALTDQACRSSDAIFLPGGGAVLASAAAAAPYWGVHAVAGTVPKTRHFTGRDGVLTRNVIIQGIQTSQTWTSRGEPANCFDYCSLTRPSGQRASISSTTSMARSAEPPKDSAEDSINVTFIQRDGTESTIKVAIGENMLQAAHDNDIDLEGTRAFW